MRKKIAIIVERTNIALGGAERSVFELSKALMALGHEVDIIAAQGKTKTRHIHILCQSNEDKRTHYPVFEQAIKAFLAENRYDIIHSVLPFGFADVYQPRGGSYAESILRNAAGFQNKLVEYYKRTTAFLNFRRTILLRAEKKLCKKTDGSIVAALSQYVAEQFKKHYGLSPERLTVIPNGIKLRHNINQRQADKLRSQIFAEFNIKESDQPIFFLFVANNFRLKGLSALIKAIQLSLNTPKNRPTYFIIAGRDSSVKYRLLAAKSGVHKRLIFLGPVRSVQKALSISDVAVLPTFYDPASRFILEALAAGKPVITTAFNGATDLFENNRHGKIIEKPENIEQLADAVNYFSDENNIQKASQAIIEDNLKEKISIARVAKQLDSLYDSIIQKRRQK